MRFNRYLPLLVILAGVPLSLAYGQMIRPPSFAGGVPGVTALQAISNQRHQMRTLLYREALAELRKNPQAADVPDCTPGNTDKSTLCLRRPETVPTPEQLAVTAGVEQATRPDSVRVETKADSKPESNLKEPAPVQTPTPAQTPGPASVALPDTEKPVVPPVAATAPVTPQPTAMEKITPPTSRRLAVLVGNNGYTLPIPPLETPIADVEKIAEVLRTRYGFETRVIRNATKAQIVQAINQVADETSLDDKVLLFYAGHGYLMDDTKMGFWIPVDASVKTAANWISNTDISKLLQAIRARQLILVSDSCFSGSLTKEQKMTADGMLKSEEILRRRSVLAFSSGGEEPVSDEGKEGHSIFAWNLIKTLDAAQGMTPGFKVYGHVYGQVKKDAAQEPQYGAVVSAGHMSGGEYLFDAR